MLRFAALADWAYGSARPHQVDLRDMEMQHDLIKKEKLYDC